MTAFFPLPGRVFGYVIKTASSLSHKDPNFDSVWCYSFHRLRILSTKLRVSVFIFISLDFLKFRDLHFSLKCTANTFICTIFYLALYLSLTKVISCPNYSCISTYFAYVRVLIYHECFFSDVHFQTNVPRFYSNSYSIFLVRSG